MSINTRACALAAPGGRARRARTAQDGKVSNKKISEQSKKTRACAVSGTMPKSLLHSSTVKLKIVNSKVCEIKDK